MRVLKRELRSAMQRVFSAIQSVGILLEPRPRAADDAQRCLMKLIIAEEKQRREELDKKGIRNNFGRNLRLLNGHVFEEYLLKNRRQFFKEKHFLRNFGTFHNFGKLRFDFN